MAGFFIIYMGFGGGAKKFLNTHPPKNYVIYFKLRTFEDFYSL